MGLGADADAPPVKRPRFSAYSEREETPLEHALEEKWNEGSSLLKHLPKRDGESHSFYPDLVGALFCGHVVTDLDSIAGAIGAAHLYGGTPARASDINSETTFALKEWGCELPDPVEDLLAAQPGRNVCLVDFQQQTQLHAAIPMANIVGEASSPYLQNSFTRLTTCSLFNSPRNRG